MSGEQVASQLPTDPEIDFLILADRAEAVNGKLYVMGGAWETTYVQDIKQPVPISFAVGVLVPWNATNHDYDLEIRIENPDAREVFRMSAHFNQGRPPTVRPGDPQRVILAAAALPVIFPAIGGYYAIARIMGGQSGTEKKLAFRLETLQVFQSVR